MRACAPEILKARSPYVAVPSLASSSSLAIVRWLAVVTFTMLSIAAGAGSVWLPPCGALARMVAQSDSIRNDPSMP